MRTIIFVAAIFLSGSLSHATSPNPDWYKCNTAAQCVVVKGNCGVTWAANQKFAEQTRKHPPRSEGPCKKALEQHPPDTAAMCIEAKCTLYPGGSYADGKPIDKDRCVLAQCWGHLGCNYLECTQSDGTKVSKFAQ